MGEREGVGEEEEGRAERSQLAARAPPAAGTRGCKADGLIEVQVLLETKNTW